MLVLVPSMFTVILLITRGNTNIIFHASVSSVCYAGMFSVYKKYSVSVLVSHHRFNF